MCLIYTAILILLNQNYNDYQTWKCRCNRQWLSPLSPVRACLLSRCNHHLWLSLDGLITWDLIFFMESVIFFWLQSSPSPPLFIFPEEQNYSVTKSHMVNLLKCVSIGSFCWSKIRLHHLLSNNFNVFSSNSIKDQFNLFLADWQDS